MLEMGYISSFHHPQVYHHIVRTKDYRDNEHGYHDAEDASREGNSCITVATICSLLELLVFKSLECSCAWTEPHQYRDSGNKPPEVEDPVVAHGLRSKSIYSFPPLQGVVTARFHRSSPHPRCGSDVNDMIFLD
jgi:hypothetical protein